MYRSERLGSAVVFVVSATLLCALVGAAALSERFSGFSQAHMVTSADVTTVHGTQTLDLPGSISDLPAHSAATMTFTADVENDDVLYLHSVYSSYKVYADGRLLSSIGTGEDAPPSIHVRPAHGGAHRLA